MTRLAAALVAVGLVVGAAGCAIGPEDSPRDIEPEAIGDLPLSVSGGGAPATGTGLIYLVAPDATGTRTLLEDVARDVPSDPAALLQALLAGPNDDEVAAQLRTAIPAGLQLLEVRRRAAGVLLVDVSSEITELSGDELIAAVAQIVFTATALRDVRAVQLAVNGMTMQWPAGNGELRSEPLSIYDYPGIDPSSQPPYPGLPL